MLLKNLIDKIPEDKKKIVVSGLSLNSQKIKNNYMFFAIKGNKTNGENYISNAIKNGASVIVCSKSCSYKSKDILVLKTNKVRNLLSEVSSKFYKLKPKNIIAVTGTNGKTSVADFYYQILRANSIPAGSIGTLGVKYNNKIKNTHLTSPDTISIHKYLYYLKKKNIDNVIIETSSHGLHQKRCHNINFKAAIFTNFSQDHLDYHKTMKSYLDAKLILFKEILNKKSTIISDNEIPTFKILKKIASRKNIKIQDINEEMKKINNISSKFDDYKIKNLAMAIKAARLCGLKDKSIIRTIQKIKDVNGRQELVKKYPNNIRVFVDYAHTPDALLKTLESLKNYSKNISLVFGCGGDRDKKKRPLMAKIADENCKKIYITDDNPRNESPKKIRNQLLENINKTKVYNVGNRASAIKKAIKNSSPNEIILVAGKGHEEQQIYKNKINYISDKKIIKKLKIKKRILNKTKQNYIQNKLIFKKMFGKNKFFNFSGLSIDSRTIKNNNLFLALKGKNSDGKRFIKDALKKRAGCIVSSSNFEDNKKKILKVKKPILFLNEFAKLKREYSFAKIIAITGSAGKTSLKNLISYLLNHIGNTYSSPKSFNNYLGVPISLSNLNSSDEFGVFEIGMSKGGEIRNLSKLIKPDLGVITNIGEAHLENFKNLKGIAQAKSEIIENIKKGGTIVLNKDDKFYKFLFKKAKLYKLKVLSFGTHKKSDILLKKIIKKKHTQKVFLNVNYQPIEFEIKDLNIYNALASIAVLHALKIDPRKMVSKMKNFDLSEGRGKKYLVKRYNKKFNFIDESYNANPLSVKNAINKFNSIKKKNFKKYLILGDMLELGSKSKKYHEELSKVINNSDIDKVFIKGKKTIFTYKQLYKDKRGNILQNNEDIDLSLSRMISNNDYLMIKGSNATGLNDFSKKMIRGN
tara:strand:- start:20626 stop:23382 length:2757 start_codon:yes stop_codon:yes gene_type:complete